MDHKKKDIFIKRDDESPKDRYYQMLDKRLNHLCMENKRQQEYIMYLEHILDQNRINFFRVNML